jgi:protein phosphatase
MVIVESAGISHVGKKRNQNEDSLFFDDKMGLYVVADGMGGHLAGEVASRLVVETMQDSIRQFKENENSDELAFLDDSLSKEANHLLSSIRLSNRVVHNASLQDESVRGMGSTVSAIYFTQNSFVVGNVGDSPVYLIRDGNIELVSVLHTVFAEQTARDPEYADLLGNEFKHVLTRAMGVDESVQAHINEVSCHKNDILVISSDGLSDKASPEEILRVVKSTDSNAACQELVNLANDRGGDDNITAIILKVKTVKREYRGFRAFLSSILKFLGFTSSFSK